MGTGEPLMRHLLANLFDLGRLAILDQLAFPLTKEQETLWAVVGAKVESSTLEVLLGIAVGVGFIGIT